MIQGVCVSQEEEAELRSETRLAPSPLKTLGVWVEASSVSTTAIAGGGIGTRLSGFVLGTSQEVGGKKIPKQEANPKPKKGKSSIPLFFPKQQATAYTKTISDFEGINAAK